MVSPGQGCPPGRGGREAGTVLENSCVPVSVWPLSGEGEGDPEIHSVLAPSR